MAKTYYERMLNYLPPFWWNYEEMKQILNAEAIEFASLNKSAESIVTDAFIMTAGDSRISEWEKWLKLPKSGTLEERRLRVAQYFGILAKFNEQSVNALTGMLHNGARAYLKFDNGYIKITVVPLPARFMDELDFTQLIEQLKVKKPCHLMLEVKRGYSSWRDIKENFQTWRDVKNKLNSWEEVLMYIPR